MSIQDQEHAEGGNDGSVGPSGTPATANLLDLAKGSEEQAEQAAKRILEIWEQQDPAERRRHVFRQRNRLWMRGYPAVQAVPASNDLGDWKLDLGYGMGDMRPVGSRLPLLIRRLASHSFVDEPKPQVTPAHDDDEANDAAEFEEQLLTIDGAPGEENDLLRWMAATERASLDGSAFDYYYVDPTGNGWRPMAMMAAPTAISAEQPTVGADGQPVDENQFVTRYIKPDKTFTDNQIEADRQWLPKICAEEVSAYQVRPIPASAQDVDHALGCLVLFPFTLGKLKSQYPVIAALDKNELQTLVNWRPIASRWALPWYLQHRGLTLPKGPEGEPNDDEIVWTLCWHMKSVTEYPEGGYILTTAGKYILYAEKAAAQVETDEGPQLVLLDLPVAQCKQLRGDDWRDFYGRGIVDELGPSDSVRMQVYDGALTHMDRFLYPHVYLPMGTNVQPEQLANRGVAPILFNPAGQPNTEEVPPFDPTSTALMQQVTQDQDDTLGMLAPSYGAPSPNVTSAKQGAQLIQGSYANLATIRQHQVAYIVRGWRIKSQLWRAYCTIPQKVRFVGDDGAFLEREWSGSDLSGETTISIRPGSFTQQSPQEKEQYVFALLSNPSGPLIDRDEADRLLASNVSARLGRLDDPARRRVKRQLAAWRDGPPEGWVEAATKAQQVQQQAQAMQQQMVQDAQAAGIPPDAIMPEIQQRVEALTKQAPMPPSPFDDLPPDHEPPTAKIRHLELKRAIERVGFAKWPAPWQGTLLAAYQSARQDAGMILPAEAAKMQEEQAQKGAALHAQTETQISGAKEQQKGQVQTVVDSKRIAQETDANAALQTHEAVLEATMPMSDGEKAQVNRQDTPR